MFNCCSHGTLLHFSLQSSRLNICYYHQDLHPRRLHPGSLPRLPRSPRRPSYSSLLGFGITRDGPVWVRRSSAIHFQGWLIRQFTIFRVPAYALLLRPTADADGTGRWCAPPSTRERIPPGPARDCPRFHCAFGFRTTQ
ncbi:hypothetical protein RRG08_049560 [Elysia crispata]|uniref:Uncharacterized protein n=1 Tax=Elysia crispata TaxID=231223 RepID=A0AAE0YGY4_9GAST|nr:hypothetical protein RRG08_062947 [Elysia crispata]KAK3745135.1 hypothetical protein RRG08_062962 [Elysia crispata]KAK3745150.1 hypothetical protein RRG08_062977 [Elysia crispata]KAK3745165.1 hypothetical protein RRG08_062992 [Elysia crispata]KAK3762682.1 hypothetical protein RRG08_049546 [Elysia crispata]